MSTDCVEPGSCISAKPRPITASPTSLTGIAPGTGHGQRSRSSRSAPVNSSMVVRQSTRSTPLPQRQGLGVAQQFVDAPAHHQPLAERAAVGLHRRRRRPTSRPRAPWAAGARVPRPPADATDTPRRPRVRCRPARRRSVRGRRRLSDATAAAARRVDRESGSARWRSAAPSTGSQSGRGRPRTRSGRPASPATARRAPARSATGRRARRARAARRRRRRRPAPRRRPVASRWTVTTSVRSCANGFHTTTGAPSTALDSSVSALSRAARPSSHASRQPVSRSRYTWSDSEPVIASWCAP